MNEDIDHRKLRTYVTFKKNIRLEKYLLTDSHYLGRAYHTSLRTGSNTLEIDQGRRKRIHRDFRFCIHCDSKAVESEKHFLLDCPRYQDLRNKLFASILEISNGKWELVNRSSEDQFLLLMAGSGDQYESRIFKTFHKYLVKCFKLRKEESSKN